MGSPKWTEAVSLRNARIVCLAGDGPNALLPTVLQLEVDGELIDKTIPILPLKAAERINSVVVIDRVLPPGSELRIKCVRAPVAAPPAYEARVREVGVNLEGGSATGMGGGTGQWAPAAADLHVMWVNGQEQMRLFEYELESANGTWLFTESVPGRATGRASIVNGPDCEIRIQGETVLRIADDQVLQCGWFTASGSSTRSVEGPRLEFWRGWQGHHPPQRVASLTKSGELVTVDVSEVAAPLAVASVEGTVDRFALLGNDAPAAVIGPVGISALRLREGF
jgi:hypothetical protein